MAVSDATFWYTKLPGDPDEQYITPQRATQAIEQVYADMPEGLAGAARWFVGHGGISVTTTDLSPAKPGDFYLDIDTYDVWRLN